MVVKKVYNKHLHRNSNYTEYKLQPVFRLAQNQYLQIEYTSQMVNSKQLIRILSNLIERHL